MTKNKARACLNQLIGSKLGKEYDKAVYCPPAYLTYMQNTSCGRLDWRTPKPELRYADDTTDGSN